ncbi:MAG TPA: hypothetical protein DCP90_00260 [Clostridiales bacterium]|nr:MAG: hypothetical protein A2Y22_04460 [Clostridiales bacterium GWD2_32_59]HAN09028.1 hypothetical protein [Clostridiales bacterium]
MKNIVYIIISSAVILGILGVIINLYKTNYEILHAVTTGTDKMGNVNADGMTVAKTYTGSDVISFLRYNEETGIRIIVETPTAVELIADAEDRSGDINIIVNEINGNNGTSYMDEVFDVVVNATKTQYRFTR